MKTEPKIELYNMDCMEVMKIVPDKAFDFIVSDPPYNIDFAYNSYQDNLTEEKYTEILSSFQYPYKTVLIHYPEETMQYLVPAIGIPEKVMAWCYNSNIPRQFRLINFFNCRPDLSRVKQPYKNLNDKRIKEILSNGGDGAKLYDWFSDIDLVKNVSDEKMHPCPVPVVLMERIIILISDPGQTIFDPFMGSGTTAIACLNTGRNFIGAEIDKNYFEVSQKRIENHKKQGQLF